MSTFTPFQGHYVNHIGSCIHPVTSAIFMAVTYHPGGSGPFNLQIYRHAAPYTAPPELLRQWTQGSPDAPGPFGFCTLECLPDGSLYIGAAVGAQSAGQIAASYHIEPNMCAPFTAGQTGPQGPKGDTGPQGPPGPAGSGSGDALSVTDRAALKWISDLRALLRT